MQFRNIDIIKSALMFIGGNLKELLVVALLPATLLVFLNIYWSFLKLDSYYLTLEIMKTGVPLGLLEIPINYETVLGLGNALLLTLIAVRIIRFKLLKARHTLVPSRQDLNSWFFTCAYGVMLLAIVYAGAAILGYFLFFDFSLGASMNQLIQSFNIPLFNIQLNFGFSASPLIMLTQIIASLIICVLALNMVIRIMISLPAIAVGLRPNIFKHMLQFSGWKSWSILVWAVVIIIVWEVFSAIITLYSLSKFEQIFEKSNPTVIKLFLDANWERFIMLHSLGDLLTVTLTMLLAAYFGEAYHRISQNRPIMGAQSGNK